MTEGSQPTFSPDQRRRLRGHGLIETQIDELEAIALPLSRAWLRNPPTLQDVRDELLSIFVAVECAAAAMSGLLSAHKLTPAKREAQARILGACFEIHDDPHDEDNLIEEASHALSRMKAVVQYAQGSLLKTQRRPADASLRPVAWIHEALVSGFAKGHCQPLPAYTLRVSSSEGSPFREIVGICYEAMGRKNTDPERAIKAFIAWRRAKDEAGRAAFGIENTVLKRRGRPRRIGQQGKKKHNLAS